MTAQELCNILQKCAPDAQVLVETDPIKLEYADVECVRRTDAPQWPVVIQLNFSEKN